MRSQIEIEEDLLFGELENGLISQQEYNKELNALHRDYHYEAEEAAERAYDEELSRW